MLKAINQGQYSLHYILMFQVAESKFTIFFWIAFTKNQLYLHFKYAVILYEKKENIIYFTFFYSNTKNITKLKP